MRGMSEGECTGRSMRDEWSQRGLERREINAAGEYACVSVVVLSFLFVIVRLKDSAATDDSERRRKWRRGEGGEEIEIDGELQALPMSMDGEG